ncbi:rodlin [Streptomyces sp. NPDC058067]|uniref:RdlA protein n=1 Tax=Streptomyces antnestii TaxID=2494256 RepID=A0A437PZ22_9ACTN|nr:rodlin [Streptomyces sp. San01]RVU27519.1 RdlA protein [Streptomyces sp. San01]
MIKKVLITAAAAASVVGMSTTGAMASGDDGNSANLTGNLSKQEIGSSHSTAPSFSLINGGVANCIDVQKVAAAVPVGVIAVPVGVNDLLNPMANQTCTQNSVQQKGDDPLSHILDDILADNGNAG